MIRSIEWKTTSWLFSNIPKQIGYLQYSLILLFLPPPAPLPHPAFVSVCIIQSLPQWLWGAPERSRLLLDKARTSQEIPFQKGMPSPGRAFKVILSSVSETVHSFFLFFPWEEKYQLATCPCSVPTAAACHKVMKSFIREFASKLPDALCWEYSLLSGWVSGASLLLNPWGPQSGALGHERWGDIHHSSESHFGVKRNGPDSPISTILRSCVEEKRLLRAQLKGKTCSLVGQPFSVGPEQKWGHFQGLAKNLVSVRD